MNTPTESGTPKPRRRFSRRRFLQVAGSVVAAAGLGGAGYYAARDRVRIGLIGCGTRGTSLAEILRKTGYYLWRHGTVVAVADVNLPRADALRQKHCEWADVYQDYRRLLSREDITAVLVATPNHAHAHVALDALRAGKAVYHEKPFSHTIAESQALVAAVRQSGLPFLVGTQQRSTWSCRTACELVRDGRLGRVAKATVTLSNKGGRGGPFAAKPVPDGLDWDGWIGPAPFAAYCPERYSGFHAFWDYGGGELLNWGPHHTDIAMWGLGLENTFPTRVTATGLSDPQPAGGYEVPTDFRVRLEFPRGEEVEIATTDLGVDASGVKFVGENGSVWADRAALTGPAADALASAAPPPSLHPSPASKVRTTVAHLCHFLEVVRGRIAPVSDAESAHRSNVALLLAAISMRLGRPVAWDAATGTIPGDPEAQRLISPPRRPGYELG